MDAARDQDERPAIEDHHVRAIVIVEAKLQSGGFCDLEGALLELANWAWDDGKADLCYTLAVIFEGYCHGTVGRLADLCRRYARERAAERVASGCDCFADLAGDAEDN